MNYKVVLLALALLSQCVSAGPVGAGICYAGKFHIYLRIYWFFAILREINNSLKNDFESLSLVFCLKKGCAAVVVACFAAGGAVFGATAGKIFFFALQIFMCWYRCFYVGAAIAASPALAACNSAFGICEAACVAALVAPTP